MRYPAHSGIALALADAFHASGRLTEAVSSYETALRLNETSAEAWYGAGCAELARKAFGAAALALGRAAELAPKSGRARYNLGKALFELGRVDEAIRNFEVATRLDPELAPLATRSIACIIPGSPAADHAAVRRARQNWARLESRNCARTPLRTGSTRPGKKLRIGYISAFFGARNWMKPVFAVINRHDRDAFAIKMFCDGAPPSAESGYADHPQDEIHDLTGVPNDRAAAIIAQTGVDVLVDLNGYSAQERLPVLMRRPAGKIVGWFNIFATTGIDAYDWLVGDATAIRRAEERFYGERIFRVPGTYLAFEVLYKVPDVAPPPCLEAAGKITFGCLGSHYKLVDPVLDAWAAILRGAPHSRLFVKNGALEDASTRADFLHRLQDRGIDPGRVTLEGRSAHFDFLDAYRQVDIALDTFPYNGGTTTTEALWQGVPVLAFDGDRWAARTSASLLNAAGLRDWLQPGVEDYVAHAIDLGNAEGAPMMLSTLRREMRTMLRRSAACDAGGLCSALEHFYQGKKALLF